LLNENLYRRMKTALAEFERGEMALGAFFSYIRACCGALEGSEKEEVRKRLRNAMDYCEEGLEGGGGLQVIKQCILDLTNEVPDEEVESGEETPGN